MMRWYDLASWVALPAGKTIGFDNPKPRTVRLDVQLEEPGVVRVTTGEGVMMAGYVASNETIEFFASGQYVVGADVDMYVYTSDLEVVHIENEGGEAYTRIVERRQRNPELEAMERRMHENMQRLFAKTQNEREAAVNRRVAEELRRRDEQRSRQEQHAEPPATPVVGGQVPAAGGSAEPGGGVDEPA